jgi:hypothetical protein
MGEGEPVVTEAKSKPSPAVAMQTRKPKSQCGHNRRVAQTRLDELFCAAAASRFWGVIAVEVVFIS